jgi:iron(III) transport system permease protein
LAAGGESTLNGQAGRRTEATRSGVEDVGRRAMAYLWVALLLAILSFLVIYPVLTLLLGALTDTNPVVDGFSLRHLSISNFLTVLANPNVAEALANTLIACGGGTLIAVVIGLAFSWIVVRTNTPLKGLIAAASILPLFAPPLVAGVAWSILGSPKTGLIELGNLTSLKVAPVYPEGFDPKVVKVWYPNFDEYVKLHAAWVADWDKIFGYRQ